MENDFTSNKKSLVDEFSNICGDNSSKILETKGLFLNEIPCKISIELLEKLFVKVQNVSSYHEEEFSTDSELQQIQSSILKAMDINTSMNKAKRILNRVIERLDSNPNGIAFASEMEVAQIMEDVLSDETTPNDFQLNEEKLYQIIIKNTCQNLAIDSGLFVAGSILSLEDLEKFDPRLAFHAKKTAFDQSIANTFSIIPENYDELCYIESLDSSNKLNKLTSDKIKEGQIVFVYINMTEMDKLEFPKFATILDSKTGLACYIQETAHEKVMLEIPCEIAGNQVSIQVPVYKGFITTTIEQ